LYNIAHAAIKRQLTNHEVRDQQPRVEDIFLFAYRQLVHVHDTIRLNHIERIYTKNDFQNINTNPITLALI